MIDRLLLLSLLATAGAAQAEWELVWRDEFDGTKIDRTRWDFDVGNGFYDYTANVWISGWGNDERQYYTRSADNAFVHDGQLHIRARKESKDGFGFTSARLKTRARDGAALFNKKYGRFEFRAKLPVGQGLWPALWLLPQQDAYGGWASSGEIDVLEARGQEPHRGHGTLHFGSRWPHNAAASAAFLLPDDATIADFHVYAVEWEPDEFRWYVDGRQFGRQRFWWSSSRRSATGGAKPTSERDLNPWPAPFDQPFYIVMNLAVGGKFVGDPDTATPFPAEMRVDYVRVYDRVGGYGEPRPRGEGELPFAR